MNLLHHCYSPSSSSSLRLLHPHRPFNSSILSRRYFTIRSSLPFPDQRTKYHSELRAAVNVVEQACRLCVDVKKSLFSSDGQILEKNDQTPVTIADFSVQALISLELGELFPSIPLVAEEDSAFLRSNDLVNSVVTLVTDKATSRDIPLTKDDILEAIDRGKDASDFGSKPATYWILDPIDGTRGFLKGTEALYVVGLALVVEGEIVLGVMGCPNWNNEDYTESKVSGLGIIMVAHVGCGTWSKRMSHISNRMTNNTIIADSWTRCFVDNCSIVYKARFCSPDSQSWDLLPLSQLFDSTTDVESVTDKVVLLLPACCGSLCKYLMVASGRATIFIQRARAQKVMKVWDHAVGIICVEEAGGKVTDWEGSAIDIAVDEAERRVLYPSGGVLVSNNSLHSEIISLISSHPSVI